MSDARWERWASATGIAFVVVAIVAYLVMGNLPATDGGGSAIAAFFTDDRGMILTGMYLYGIALVLFLWFIGTMASAIREAGQPRLAAIGFAGGITAAGLFMGGTTINLGLAHRIAADGDEGVVAALYDVSALAYTVSAFPVTALVLATAIATLRGAIFPQWFAGLSGLGAIWFLVGGAAYAESGFFAPDGGWATIGFFVFMGWTLIASGLLVQRQTAAAPRPAAAAM